MIYNILHNKIIAQIDTKINRAVLSHVTENDSFGLEATLFKICFFTAVTAIMAGVAVNLHYHNLFY